MTEQQGTQYPIARPGSSRWTGSNRAALGSRADAISAVGGSTGPDLCGNGLLVEGANRRRSHGSDRASAGRDDIFIVWHAYRLALPDAPGLARGQLSLLALLGVMTAVCVWLAMVRFDRQSDLRWRAVRGS